MPGVKQNPTSGCNAVNQDGKISLSCEIKSKSGTGPQGAAMTVNGNPFGALWLGGKRRSWRALGVRRKIWLVRDEDQAHDRENEQRHRGKKILSRKTGRHNQIAKRSSSQA
jgi:hypothetical protein